MWHTKDLALPLLQINNFGFLMQGFSTVRVGPFVTQSVNLSRIALNINYIIMVLMSYHLNLIILLILGKIKHLQNILGF